MGREGAFCYACFPPPAYTRLCSVGWDGMGWVLYCNGGAKRKGKYLTNCGLDVVGALESKYGPVCSAVQRSAGGAARVL